MLPIKYALHETKLMSYDRYISFCVYSRTMENTHLNRTDLCEINSIFLRIDSSTIRLNTKKIEPFLVN